ncbi:MAG: S8 family serine peptidase [Deltaproteobacteria bacterium]|nr:S8 family serine peptidase [Deltaproteobacteria bacterium]MBI3077214.1 S8 family serine peptidase [Deltaproteobacteria bacterium]
MNLRVLKEFPSLNLRLVSLPAGQEVSGALAQLTSGPNVLYAEPNYVLEPQAVPNDPSFGLQWHLRNTGQTVNDTAGTSGADISATTAWDSTTGSSSVVVAIIDTGADLNHPDLSENIDSRSHDFVLGTSNPQDTSGHGTSVAGIIGAVGNNGVGVAGVAWTAKLMVLRAGVAALPIATVIEAITYAKDNGAQIANISAGTTVFSRALKEAIDGAPGLLFVTAAGNSATDNDQTPTYPASFDSANVIAVAATDQNDNLASFSNFGATSVDLAAPGRNITTTQLGGGVRQGFTGTSAAAPVVAGVAALVKALFPSKSVSELKSTILDGIDRKSPLCGKLVTGGRVNAKLAVTEAPAQGSPCDGTAGTGASKVSATAGGRSGVGSNAASDRPRTDEGPASSSIGAFP